MTLLKIIVPYVLLLGVLLALLFSAKDWALEELSSSASKAEWDVWREDVRQKRDLQAGTVERRIPKSPEPPALVLMRDHFAICLLAAVGFSSLLYAVITWFLWGALSGSHLSEKMP